MAVQLTNGMRSGRTQRNFLFLLSLTLSCQCFVGALAAPAEADKDSEDISASGCRKLLNWLARIM